MNIILHWEEARKMQMRSGGYSLPQLDIYLAPDLPPKQHREIIIHEVIENYARVIAHKEIVDLTDKICEALEAYENGDIA